MTQLTDSPATTSAPTGSNPPHARTADEIIHSLDTDAAAGLRAVSWRVFPRPEFTKYAPLFGQWSLMMHADGADEPLSQTARDELRSIEYKIDRLTGRLHYVESDTWVRCAQLNIDGRLIEWKSS